MNIKQLFVFTAILILLFACITKKSGNKEEKMNIKVKEETEMLTKQIRQEEKGGAFVDADINSEYIRRAFKFLVSELAVTHPEIIMGELQSARSQVVAGLNILLECEYESALDKYILKALIYQNLDYELSLKELYLAVRH